MTDAERERLIMLVEECSEVIHAATKALRHGYESQHPDNVNFGWDNRADLERELLDLDAVRLIMLGNGDISEPLKGIEEAVKRKLKYAHHQHTIG